MGLKGKTDSGDARLSAYEVANSTEGEAAGPGSSEGVWPEVTLTGWVEVTQSPAPSPSSGPRRRG